MYGSYGGGYTNSASGFAANIAYSTNGGNDTAVFFGSSGNNTYFAQADYDNSGQPLAGMYGRRLCQLGQRLRHEHRLFHQRRQ